jgi:colicin import membrane protein
VNKEMVMQETAPAELCAVVKREGVAEQQQSVLIGSFAPYHAQIAAARKTSETITNGADPLQRKMARECRLELRRVRCAIENTRKDAKADALRYGKAVDGMANVLKFLCEPEEERLEEIEQTEVQKEQARIAALVESRTAALIEVDANPAAYNLGAMDDATWSTVLAGAVKANQDRIETDRKAEADRIERERKEAEERASIKAENERLKAEAEKREAEIKAERDKEADERAKVEAALKAERESAQKAAQAAADEAARVAKDAADERAKRDAAEAKAKADKAAAEQAERDRLAKLAAAPDKEKLIALACDIDLLKMPTLDTNEGKRIGNGIVIMQQKMVAWIKQEAGKL